MFIAGEDGLAGLEGFDGLGKVAEDSGLEGGGASVVAAAPRCDGLFLN